MHIPIVHAYFYPNAYYTLLNLLESLLKHTLLSSIYVINSLNTFLSAYNNTRTQSVALKLNVVKFSENTDFSLCFDKQTV